MVKLDTRLFDGNVLIRGDVTSVSSSYPLKSTSNEKIKLL